MSQVALNASSSDEAFREDIYQTLLQIVTGVLLGRYIGSELEICDSFEMELAPGGGDGFNWDFLNVRAEECEGFSLLHY